MCRNTDSCTIVAWWMDNLLQFHNALTIYLVQLDHAELDHIHVHIKAN